MFRIATAASLCVVLTAASAFSQIDAQIKQVKSQIHRLRGQIRHLDRQERQELRQNDAKLNAAINKIGRPDNQMKAERARLAQSERDALSLETDPTVRAKIKADFDNKRAQLSTKIKGMNAKIDALKKQRHATNAPIKQKYNQQRHALRTQIKQLEGQLKQLHAAKKSMKKKKKK
jgi:chromosome segregation ATPase